MTEAGKRPSFRPGNWPGWLAVGLIGLVGRLPRRLALVLSRPLAGLIHFGMKRRRGIAERNIRRCYPDWSPAQRETLVRENFRALARAVFEIAWSWTWSDRRFAGLGRVEGGGAVATILEQGRGVLMVTAHLSCLEIGGRLLARELPAAGIYRPLRSEVLEWFQNRSRLAYGKAMISKRSMRDAIRYLRRGGLVWYAPDQDFGPEQSVFAPFFGIPTATLVATHRLARLTGCAVVPMFPAYDERSRTYTVRILPELDGFADQSPEAALGRLNAIMEAHVRTVPEQYWWIHRRFKSRPAGEAPFYE
ncbi:LpxL/LpxP family acyltransferase [Elongatibacter sediminis]|uniref:Lipid A biosynthesis lauroyl acyltransferase n=1 Tax=Elongatibacter sediminis TaxID=3119006 RepID=A0AAW9RAK0_9GAMM